MLNQAMMQIFHLIQKELFLRPTLNQRTTVYISCAQFIYRDYIDIYNAKRIDQDSIVRKQFLGEMRKMGKRSVYYDRRIDRDGKSVDSVKIVGMTESDINSFKYDFQEKLHAKSKFGFDE